MILNDHSIPQTRRRGVALMLLALLMPVFFGFFALTIDIGQAMETRRLLQATADAVAVSAAHRANRGFTSAQILTHANTIRAFNLSSSNTLGWNLGTIDTINTPPRSGPYRNTPDFYEVIVSADIEGIFAPIVGMLGPTRVVARSVAGLDDDDEEESIVALDPCGFASYDSSNGQGSNAAPGISQSGNTQMRVNGVILTNSGRGGVDQNGNTVNLGLSGMAVDLGNNSVFRAAKLSVRGGVNPSSIASISNFTTGGSNPLAANTRRVMADPLASLPIPNASNTQPAGTTAIPGSQWNWAPAARPSISVTNNQNVTINPGIYASINVNSGGRLTMTPGIYVIAPNGNNQGFRINGSVTGTNVMIYLTSSNFTGNSAGANDNADGPLNSTVINPTDTGCSFTPSTSNDGNATYASLSITSGGSSNNVSLTGITDSSSPFYRIVVFQRRRNVNAVQVAPGSGASCTINGIVYAKWAPFTVGGNGVTNITYPAAVGRFDLSGGGQLNISTFNVGWSTSKSAFLVE